MMKIVQINAVYGYGSTGVIVKDIQSACRQEGWQCHVAYSHTNQQVIDGYHMGNVFSDKLHAALSRISGKQGYFSKISTWRLLRYLDSLRPDIVHLHNLHGSYINLPMLLRYLAKRNIKTVVSLHDCWFYTGGCSHYTAVGCDRWKAHCGHCPRRYEEFPALLWDGSEKQLADRVRLFGAIKNLTVVGVSQWITNEAKQKVFRHAHCLSIHNGIDTAFFHPVTSSFRRRYQLEGKFVILAPANKWFLDINKETFSYFSFHLTDDMVMVFIGNGADEGRMNERMLNVGFVASREEIRDIYSAADVMVNCTREESLSLLNVEVQACGTPVVTYANTGVRETVDNRCGYAVANGNAETLWESMINVKKEGKAGYSTECRAWAYMEFDRQKNYQKYIQMYKYL